MLTFTNPRQTLVVGVLLAGAAVLVGMNGTGSMRDGSTTEGFEAAPGPRFKSLHSRTGPVSDLEREIRGMTSRELRDALPEQLDFRFSLHPSSIDERTKLLFIRFGEMHGEEAIDEIVSRYGCSGFSAYATGYALQGWAKRDRAGALAALYQTNHAGSAEPILAELGMFWKGSQITSGFG